MAGHSNLWRILFLLPPLAVFGVVVIWPLLDSFFYAFTNWNGFDPNYRFVGLDNFRKVFTDKLFYNAVINTPVMQKALATIQAAQAFAFNYDLATPPPVAEVGLSMFAKFMDNPAGFEALLDETQTAAAEAFKQK